MIFVTRRVFIFIGFFILIFIQGIEANQKKLAHTTPSKYLSLREWNKVKKYLMPDHHPIKKKLDLMFSSARLLCNRESAEAAGFEAFPPQHNTQIIVAKHPELRGYIIKAYFDEQQYFKGKTECEHWIRRVKGARLIQNYIRTYRYDNLFKVPKKWIYLLPDEPSPPPHHLRKMFILVEEDMEIFDDITNKLRWGSEWVTKRRLYVLYKITTDLGLLDSAQPSNCPFSIDGKAAFVDTEMYHRHFVKYEKMTPYLSPAMKLYWKKITAKDRRVFRLDRK
jgi:hypothetical protein